MRLPIPHPINTDTLVAGLQAEFGLPEPPVVSVRNEEPRVAVVPDDLDHARVEAVIAAQPNANDLDAATAVNESTIRQRAATALQGNRDFLAIQAPTNAQVVAQVRALTRQSNGLIRLILNRLDGTD